MAFITDLVRQILAGQKTETRRPRISAPEAKRGDVVWVRERALVLSIEPQIVEARLRFEADGFESRCGVPDRLKTVTPGKCLSNGVYREAARLFLPIVEVVDEGLLDITEEGAIAEGLERVELAGGGIAWRGLDPRTGKLCAYPSARTAFFTLWDSIYATAGRNKKLLASEKNPRVRVYRWKEPRSSSPLRIAA